ncbi:MAG: response regulator [Balneolales bacterium]|nr:response regulator [Balneolales bacterium]
MELQFNIFSVLLLIAAIATSFLAIMLFRKTGYAGRVFGMAMVSLSIWAFGYSLELTSTTLDQMLMWINVEYIGIGLIPGFWFTFCLAYSGREDLLTKSNLIAVFAIPVLTIVMVWTNQWHNLHYASVSVSHAGPFPMLSFERGIWYFVHMFYFYVLLLIGGFLLLQNYRHAAHFFKRQTLIVLFGALAPWFVNLLYHLGFRPYEYIDLTPFVFTITGLIIGVGLLQFKLFQVVPIAREKVIEGLLDGVMVLDNLNRIIYQNPVMVEYTSKFKEDVIGRSFQLVFAAYPEFVQTVLKGENTHTFVEIRDDNDNTTYFDVKINTIATGDSNLNGLLIVFRDYTEQKISEKELINARLKAEESDRLKTAFLANMSHEIRNPMNGIIGFAGILKDPELSESEREHYLQIIESNAEQLLLIINDIIDISKIESGQEHIKPSNASIKKLIDDLRNVFSHQIKNKNLTFGIENLIAESDDEIITDVVKLRQILVNLIGNAVKFTNKGNITLQVEKIEDELLFSVIDTGIGIKSADLDLIFDRFRQSDQDNTAISRGTGLGLAISRGYANLLGGTLTASSKIGSGSTFLLKIPHISAENAVSKKQRLNMDNIKAEIPNWTGKTILLAEDEPVNIMYMKIALKKTNADVLVANTGREAVSKFTDASGAVDVILMDIKMPEMDGFEATDIIRSSGAKTPIIALSGHAMLEKERIERAGFNELIAKPIRKDDLLNALRKWLD